MKLQVGRIEHDVHVLGPPGASVVWVSGCGIGCQGCTTPELWSPSAGTGYDLDVLVAMLVEHGAGHVTWSGGEPFDQAPAVSRAISAMRAARPNVTHMVYSGYPLRHLRRRGAGARALLEAADLLVDGPYVERRHASLRWRGSSNQRLVDLSGRLVSWLAEPDVTAGVQKHVDPDGRFRFSGVAPVPRFRDQIEAALGRGEDDTDDCEEGR
jgi:anaerobic ribonucleoside-triphosphate reductase activating protein